jgi:hypothetical protein
MNVGLLNKLSPTFGQTRGKILPHQSTLKFFELFIAHHTPNPAVA